MNKDPPSWLCRTLAITPRKQTGRKRPALTFAIELLCDSLFELRPTPTNMTPTTPTTISTTNIFRQAPLITNQLSVGSSVHPRTTDRPVRQARQHRGRAALLYHRCGTSTNRRSAFENPDGYNDFTVMYSADEAVVDFEGHVKTLNLTSLNDKTLPAPH